MVNNQLISNIRQVNQAFLTIPAKGQNSLEEGVREIATITGSLVIVIDRDGVVLAVFDGGGKSGNQQGDVVVGGSLAADRAVQGMIKFNDPVFNQEYPVQEKATGEAENEKNNYYSFVPLTGDSKRIGSLFIHHKGFQLTPEQVVLMEAVSGFVSLLLLQDNQDRLEEDARNRELAEGAFDSLSYSEVEAIREILKNITNNESIVVASKIADGLGITRSVIVNALRKFESAGIIESRSLGMKGTLIRVKNTYAMEVIASRSTSINGGY